jgi:two-component system, NtrC family, response regulator AtoC
MMTKDIYNIFFSHNSKMTKLKTVIDEISKTDMTVLIKGESGTGKELVGQTIHLQSNRREHPFIKVNCAAIPKGLIESELFGFEKGAFTGAHVKKPGKFELANGGTIMLSDIVEIDIGNQAKLLQVLQDGQFSRLGGDDNIGVNTRVIATTKDHLEKWMLEGRFREDLFYRINVISLTVPPLRDRREQLLPLCMHFFDRYKTRYGKSVPPLSPKTFNIFKEYHWPGNIRELENIVKRIVLLGEEETVLKDIFQKNGGGKTAPGIGPVTGEVFSSDLPKESNGFDLKEVGRSAAEAAEKEAILNTLQETHWNRKEAAKLLKVSYKALLYKIQKYKLDQWKELRRSEEGHPELSKDEN